MEASIILNLPSLFSQILLKNQRTNFEKPVFRNGIEQGARGLTSCVSF